MPAKRAMSGVGIAVEFNVSNQEVMKCAKRRFVPIRSGEDRREHPLQPAIFITCDAHGLGERIHPPHFRKIGKPQPLDSLARALIQTSPGDHAPHELVMVQFLSLFRYARTGGEIVGVAFPLAKLGEIGILRV